MSSYSKLISLILLCAWASIAWSAENAPALPPSQLTAQEVANSLGWVQSPLDHCGGYYLEQPLTYPVPDAELNPLDPTKKALTEITSEQGIVSQVSTSILQGDVTVTREGEQATSNKTYLYRDPKTGKLSLIEMIGDVHLRQPDTLVIGNQGFYQLQSVNKSLFDIIYRMGLSGPVGPKMISSQDIPLALQQTTRKITLLTAWGHATKFIQNKPLIYQLYQTTYSTCPPLNASWHLKASHITLNKVTGRGSATNVRIYVKSLPMPVMYLPYLNFSIDHQRKSGFLVPTIGPTSSRWGPYVLIPYYWNMAPNRDMTFTTGLLSKRGVQFTDTFRYLSTSSHGSVTASILPSDNAFASFQHNSGNNPIYANSINPSTQAELKTLLSDSDTRTAFIWRDDSFYNDHWSSHVDFNYVGDDYYLENFGGNLDEITQNQLLQEGDLFYKSEHWRFTTTVQAYQTLNPIDQPVTLTQYRRLPQFLLNADYPNEPYGLDYFFDSQATYFDISNTPGIPTTSPAGYRSHIQPGISLPLYTADAFVTPRVQLALTQYNLTYPSTMTPLGGSQLPANLQRALPIYDVDSGVTLTRDMTFLGKGYHQTLEPQLYYAYVPFRDQSLLPVFDTSLNSLSYDQLFDYNRYSSIDRIGDTNQLSAGVATRFIDAQSGYQKARFAVGDIFYFADRRVTLCNSNTGALNCDNDYPGNPLNDYRWSPIVGEVDYNVSPHWLFVAIPQWDPVNHQWVNVVSGLTYILDTKHVINLDYDYVRNGDILPNDPNGSSNNLKLTDFSIGWPIYGDISGVARFSEDWNDHRLQTLIYGVQYDTCCWAVRAVAAKVFTGLNPNNNNQFQYDSQFYFQFDLKGLTDIPVNDPTHLLAGIGGYNPQFGQEV